MNIKLNWFTEDIIKHIQEKFNIKLSMDQANNILERFDYYSNYSEEKERTCMPFSIDLVRLSDYDLIEKCYFAWLEERRRSSYVK